MDEKVWSALTATIIMAGFVLLMGFAWLLSSWGESLSWVLWAALASPAALITAVFRTDRGGPVALLMVAVVVLFWIVGGVSYREWGSNRGDPASDTDLMVQMLLFALIAAPIAFGSAYAHPRLSTALSAVLVGQALFAFLTIIFPDPSVLDAGSYHKGSIVTADRFTIVALGAAGALLLATAGMLLRRHVPPWVTWPGAGAFLLAAVIYQFWYPPFSTFGD